jgi:hypothetical protein
MGTITPQQSVEATMIVDLFDAKTHALLWRGLAQEALSNNGNKNQQSVQKAVAKMLSSGQRVSQVLGVDEVGNQWTLKPPSFRSGGICPKANPSICC